MTGNLNSVLVPQLIAAGALVPAAPRKNTDPFKEHPLDRAMADAAEAKRLRKRAKRRAALKDPSRD